MTPVTNKIELYSRHNVHSPSQNTFAPANVERCHVIVESGDTVNLPVDVECFVKIQHHGFNIVAQYRR
jgi:hypothetical protein